MLRLNGQGWRDGPRERGRQAEDDSWSQIWLMRLD